MPLIICLFLLPAMASAKVEMSIGSSVGPVRNNSFNAFGNNVRKALMEQAITVGDIEREPGAYRRVSRVMQGQLLVTSFSCWSGVMQPPAPFSGERGNRLYFCLRIVGNGKRFCLSNLTFMLESQDAMGVLSSEGNYAGTNYSPHRVGIDYGPDRKRDTEDDVIFDKRQPGSVEVDEILYTGLGIGIHATAPRVTASKRAKAIEQLMNGLMGTHSNYDLKMTYTLLDDDNLTVLASASDTVRVFPQPDHVQIGPVPESPWPLFVGAGAGLGLILLVAGTRQMIRRYRHRVLSMTPLPDEELV
ncbi:MAG: hypothetical protein JKX85_11430 [Phycisphaeraceae bacterium]|nr:hypothetical protein [Phycisphaeraceae bacterium]